MQDPGTANFARANALVYTETTHTAVPGTVFTQSGVEPRATRQLKQTDGQVMQRELGQARLRLEGQEFTIPVIFLPEDATLILRAIALDPFGLAVEQEKRSLLTKEQLLY